MKTQGRRLIPFTLAIIIALLACGPFPSTATEAVVVDTPSLGQIQTSVAETISAQAMGQPSLDVTSGAPVVVSSDTPIVPTIPAGPTKTATDSQTCDKVQFISETIPDGTDFAPSAAFTKTWRVRNVGTCTWDSSYDIVFDHGSTLGAPAAVAFPGVVTPGQEVDLSVNMTAPADPGTYASFWKFRNGSDVIFVTNPFSTVIDVIAPTATSGVGIIITLPGPLIALRYTAQYWQQTSIPASSQGNIKADCPSEGVVTAGGFATSSSNMFVKTMSKDSNGWLVYAVNQLGSSQLLNSYVTCLFNSGGTTSQVFNQVSVTGGSNGHATVSCPAGSVVTGGGYASNDKFTVYNSSKDGNGWQTWAHNNSGSNQLLNAYAICLSGTTATTSQVLTSGSIPAGSTKSIESKCPSGSLVTGGGFAVSPDLLIYNTSMSDGGDGWKTAARNSTGSDMTLFSYVMCLAYP